MILAAVMICFSISLHAQTFGTVTVTQTTNYLTLIGPGSTNVQASVSGIFATNIFTLVPPTKTIYITNLDVGQTNIYAYYLQVPGLTNLIALGFSTNIYPAAGSTNQTIVPTGAQLNFPLYMGVQILGAHTNGFFAL